MSRKMLGLAATFVLAFVLHSALAPLREARGAGDSPPSKPDDPGCLYWSDGYEFAWTYGQKGYHSWGVGGVCKPEFSIGIFCCSTTYSDGNSYGGWWHAPPQKYYTVHTGSGKLPSDVTCVPLVADVVATFGGNGGFEWDVTIEDASGSTSVGGNNADPNPTSQIRRCVPFTPGKIGYAEYHMSSVIYVVAGCHQGDANCGVAQGIVDPWMYIDPEWEYASEFVVCGETSEGSGIWEPVHKNWMTTFTDVSTTEMTATDGYPYATWVDYDNDGDLDLHVVTRTTSPDQLFVNDGNGGFTDGATGPLADTGGSLGCAWGDYDNDGDLDVYLCKGQDEPNRLLRNDGGGLFTDVTSGPLGDTAFDFYAAWGDVDLDGDLDLFVTSAWPMPNKLLRNDGAGVFADITTPLLADGLSKHCSAIWGDYDGDLYPDLCLGSYENEEGSQGRPNRLFHNNGDTSFSPVPVLDLNQPMRTYGLQWIDFDNDRDLDLYVVNYGGENQLVRNDGPAGFVRQWAQAADDAGNGISVAWDDYNRDGALDLYLANYAGQGCKMIYYDAARDSFDFATGVVWGPIFDLGNPLSVAAGDYDNDGDLDLAVAGDHVHLFRNDSTRPDHWLQFDLVGVNSNKYGIGAQIRVVADTLAQMREVTSTPGFGNGSSITAEFGLGPRVNVDYVEIQWPSGLLQTISGPIPVDQKLTITEGMSSGPVVAIADLAAQGIRAGNPPGQVAGVRLNWTETAPGTTVEIWRAGFGQYPEYDDAGGSAPAAPASFPPGEGWTLTEVDSSGEIDVPPSRDVTYYVAYVKNSYGSRSAVSNTTAGTPSYHLGDVSDGGTPGVGNGRVFTEDLSLLGSHYGTTLALNDPFNYLDVGPTTTHGVDGRPLTDNKVGFEDMMIFALNYDLTSAARPVAALTTAAVDEMTLDVPEWVAQGGTAVARLSLRGSGALAGLSTRLSWDPAVVEPTGNETGEWLTQLDGVAFAPAPGVLDMAVLGRQTIVGDGLLATMRFKAVSAGDPKIRIESLEGRNIENVPLQVRGRLRSAALVTRLAPARPNPMRQTTTLSFSLAKGGQVELAIYAVDGRRVRTLLRAGRDPGEYDLLWDGRDDKGKPALAGMYYARLTTPQGAFTQPVTVLR